DGQGSPDIREQVSKLLELALRRPAAHVNADRRVLVLAERLVHISPPLLLRLIGLVPEVLVERQVEDVPVAEEAAAQAAYDTAPRLEPGILELHHRPALLAAGPLQEAEKVRDEVAPP